MSLLTRIAMYELDFQIQLALKRLMFCKYNELKSVGLYSKKINHFQQGRGREMTMCLFSNTEVLL